MWTNEKIQLLRKHYGTMSSSKLENLIGKSASSIRSKAYKLGLSNSNRSEAISLLRRGTSPIDRLFSNVNDIKACFLAGLIASDGNVRRHRGTPTISIKLKADDREYLEGIRTFYGIEKELNYIKRGPGEIQGRKVNIKDQVSLNLFSVFEAVEDLSSNFNITPNKTHTLQPPTQITNLRARLAFVAGYIDGDGSVYESSGEVNGKIYTYTKLSIYGVSHNMLTWIRDEVLGLLNPYISTLSILKNAATGVYRLTIPESALVSIVNELDTLGLPVMRRKWDKLSRRLSPQSKNKTYHSQVNSSTYYLYEILDSYGLDYSKDTIVGGRPVSALVGNIAIVVIDLSAPKDKYEAYNWFLDSEKEGIRLLQFWDKDITQKPELVKSMLSNALGIINERIYARKCEVKEISPSDYRDFLEANHLEGKRDSSIRLGLYQGDRLVSVMGFSKHKEGFELDRFCSLKDVVVIGGFSKLLKHRPEGTIVSYSFNRYSNGDVYKKNGFTFRRENKTSLFYYHEGELKNRNQFMKYKLREKLGVGEEDTRTERELAEALGAYQVFDAGTRTWILN